MSSETDHPRQRTVAELLAEHGAAGATTGRRRRRRESDGDGGEPANGTTPAIPVGGAPAPPVNGGAPPQNGAPQNGAAQNGAAQNGAPQNGAPPLNGAGIAPAAWAFPPAGPGPDRSILREPVPQEPVAAREEYRAFEFAPRAYAPEPEPPRANPPRRGHAQEQISSPTDHLPRYREERGGMFDPGLTGPIEQQPRPVLSKAPSLDEPTVQGLEDGDGGPPTMAGAPPVGARRRRGAGPQLDDEGGPSTQAAVMPDFEDDHPAGLDEVEEPRRRLGRSAGEASPGQAWAAVVAQWIVGAIGGAALWVGFRFLWRELPVVALAAAVLVTVGLVLIVRALLRNSDMRTTVFAVLVGLLLTVSPAILVLLGR